MIDPEVNAFHPVKCGQLKSYNEKNIGRSGCFKDRTIIVIGDSRARQIGGHLSVLFRNAFQVDQ